MKIIEAKSFGEILVSGAHLIDVRAPVEFSDGAIPGAINLPLLNDDERHKVGICYKIQGQVAAIQLGNHLVTGASKDERLNGWKREILRFPDSAIYCFRGGLRSQTVQTWLSDSGVHAPLIAGGYKALRRFLMESLVACSSKLTFRVVTGLTGAGKTDFLKQSGQAFLDLEALACHRGSAFGAMERPQPNQVNFENALAIALLKLRSVDGEVLIEDESRMIGHCVIPEVLFERMRQSERLALNVDIEERVENIFRDYILNSNLGLRGDLAVFASFRSAVALISRKLGGQRAAEILADLEQSERLFPVEGLDSNRIWIRKLLLWYYDPLYKRS